MRNTCPFCGKGDYPGTFAPWLDQMRKSQEVTTQRCVEQEKLIDRCRTLIESLKRSRNTVERIAIQRTLKSVCKFLKHYELKEKNETDNKRK